MPSVILGDEKVPPIPTLIAESTPPVAAAAPAALVALVLIPTGYAARGGPAMGGESLAIAVTFTVAYAVIHNFVCNKLEEVTGSETGR